MEGLTLANPFYVDPTGGVDMGQRYAQAGSALMGYSQMKDQREAQQAERERVAAAEQRMKSGIEAIQGAMNDPAKMANVMLEYPELAKQAEAVFGFSNDQTRPIVEQTYAMVLTDPQNATQHLQRGIEAVTAAGGTPNMMSRDLQMFTENPEQAFKAVEMGVAATAPKVFEAYQKTKPKTPEAMTQYQSEMVRQKDIELGLRKAENDLKIEQNRLKRETDELKKIEIEDRIESKKREAESLKREKEAAGQNALATFDRSLGVIDEIANHPSLDTAVGFKGPGAYIPGSEAQEVISLIETLQSQSFLNEVEKMKGLGALTEREGAALTQAVGSLNRDMSEKAFKRSLNRIRGYFMDAKERTRSKYGIETPTSAVEVTENPGETTIEWGSLQ